MARTKIIVISLIDALQRRTQFEQSLRDVDVDWEFFDAHRALQGDLNYRESDSLSAHGRPLRAGELGCYSSHYATWQWLVDSDYEQMMVFEDDVSVDWGFIAQLTEMDFSVLNIPYLRLFAKIPPRWRYIASPFFDRYHHLIRFTGYALGTQAYLLTKHGAQTLLQAGRVIRYPIDTFMDRYWEHGVANIALYPFPVFERYQTSSIGAARFEKTPLPPAAQLRFQLQRWYDRMRMLSAYVGPQPAAIRELKLHLRGCFSDQSASANAMALANTAMKRR